MKIVFTDLDGTLLDQHNYSYQPALPGLQRIRKARIPLVFVTSKTRAEVEVFRRLLGNDHPFIVENGGAVFIPKGYFPFPLPHLPLRDNYQVIALGVPYAELVCSLETASTQTACRVKGFCQMTVAEIASRCQMSSGQALLARQREFDEPFVCLDARCLDRLLEAIERQGKRWTEGGRFYHITGNNDKVVAVKKLVELYQRGLGEVTTIGLGDGPNDASFLNHVDCPVVICSPAWQGLKDLVPRGVVTCRPGPEGWSQAILEMVPE